jgi:hypothetical protein
VINGDTRPGLFSDNDDSTQGPAGRGTRSIDYLREGIDNKLNFFRGYEIESHLYVDVHEEVPKNLLWEMNQRVDNLTLHKHVTHFEEKKYFTKHIDLNILHAISAARGEFIVHFDWDMAAFRKDDSEVIDRWINWLNSGKFDYISYPSRATPRAANDPDFAYDWASSRFFICKRRILDFSEIMKCLEDANYLFDRYAPKNTVRKCGWLEHVQGMMAGPGRVFYPPIQTSDHMIFSWSHYINGLFGGLNGKEYEDVEKYVLRCGKIKYPCDVWGRVLR